MFSVKSEIEIWIKKIKNCINFQAIYLNDFSVNGISLRIMDDNI